MHIHVHTGSPMFLDDDEDRSARSCEREGVIQMISTSCVLIYTYRHTFTLYTCI